MLCGVLFILSAFVKNAIETILHTWYACTYVGMHITIVPLYNHMHKVFLCMQFAKNNGLFIRLPNFI